MILSHCHAHIFHSLWCQRRVSPEGFKASSYCSTDPAILSYPFMTGGDFLTARSFFRISTTTGCYTLTEFANPLSQYSSPVVTAQVYTLLMLGLEFWNSFTPKIYCKPFHSTQDMTNMENLRNPKPCTTGHLVIKVHHREVDLYHRRGQLHEFALLGSGCRLAEEGIHARCYLGNAEVLRKSHLLHIRRSRCTQHNTELHHKPRFGSHLSSASGLQLNLEEDAR